MSNHNKKSPVIADRSVVDNAANLANRTVKIICRHIVYNCIVAEPRPYKKPRALNWRYQVPGETYNQSVNLDRQYQKPRAINWRWQTNSD
jgi:hypothetical protein